MGTSSRIRSTSSGLEAGLEQTLRGASADEPLRARAGVDADRLDADDAAHDRWRDAAAMPISDTISCVASLVTGVVRSYG